MPKYLVSASYTADGLKGLQKDKASGRRQAVTAAIEGMGGKLECVYYALGENDVYLVVDLPDNVSAAALAFAVNESGAILTKTVVLLTPEEVDKAVEKKINFRAPGR